MPDETHMNILLSRRRRIALGLVAAVALLMGVFVTLQHLHLLGDTIPVSTLYFKNVSGDSAWENPANWFTDAAATTQAISAPWVQDDQYRDYNLSLSDEE